LKYTTYRSLTPDLRTTTYTHNRKKHQTLPLPPQLPGLNTSPKPHTQIHALHTFSVRLSCHKIFLQTRHHHFFYTYLITTFVADSSHTYNANPDLQHHTYTSTHTGHTPPLYISSQKQSYTQLQYTTISSIINPFIIHYRYTISQSPKDCCIIPASHLSLY
jgi:hypothetical protein